MSYSSETYGVAGVTPQSRRDGLQLALALIFGAVAVWQLRQEGARESGAGWPWLLLIGVVLAGAYALAGMERWLPIAPEPIHAVPFPNRQRWAWGLFCLVTAIGLVGWVVIQLWPDYQQWEGTPRPWIGALALTLIGAWLIGAVGNPARRAAMPMAPWAPARSRTLLEIAAFVAIFGLAIFLRVYRIDQIPPGIYVDETNGALDALYLLEGRPDSPFGTSWYETPTGYIYYMAGLFKLLGANYTALKVASLIPAILTVPAVYLLGRLLFGPLAGLCAMLLFGVNRWHLSLSRWGWNETAPPLFQVLSIFFLIRGLRDRRAIDYAVGGMLAGLSIYTYLSSRLALATIMLFIMLWLLTDSAGWRGALRRSWAGLALFGLALLITLAPITVTFYQNPFAFSNRTSEINIFREVRERESLEPLINNIGDILKFFHQAGDKQGKHNLPFEPHADPISGLLFAIGLGYAVLRWRDHRRGLLLLWLILGLAGSYLSSTHESPQAYRSLTAAPAVALLAADTLERAARSFYTLLRAAFPTSALARHVTAGLLALSLGGSALWEGSTFFIRQADSSEVQRGFNLTENGVALEVLAALRSNTDVYLSPTFYDFSPLRFLVYGFVKEQTGQNTLDDRPYRLMAPEVDLPLADNGGDALVLLDRTYWPLRDYIADFYPEAQISLVQTSDGEPLYMRIWLTRAQIAAEQGLVEQITYADGRQEQRVVSQIDPPTQSIVSAEWIGSIRLEHGGTYTLIGEGGLQVFVDGREWNSGYLGRGMYALRVVQPQGSQGARLSWITPDGRQELIPATALFRMKRTNQGLLGTYYRNERWEGEPLFSQVTPFLMLAWPNEKPVIPEGPFSAHYTGALRIAQPGRYRLRIEADDGARLILDGETRAEALEAGRSNDLTVELDLEAGDHPIQIDYFQRSGGTALKFFWRYGDQPELPVPPTALLPEN